MLEILYSTVKPILSGQSGSYCYPYLYVSEMSITMKCLLNAYLNDRGALIQKF